MLNFPVSLWYVTENECAPKSPTIFSTVVFPEPPKRQEICDQSNEETLTYNSYLMQCASFPKRKIAHKFYQNGQYQDFFSGFCLSAERFCLEDRFAFAGSIQAETYNKLSSKSEGFEIYCSAFRYHFTSVRIALF